MAVVNSIIEQKPLYETIAVGSEIMFVVSNQDAVLNESRVKFVAKIHISNDTPPVLSNNNHLIGTFKISPNNAGVGMIDVSNVVEKYVSSDNSAVNGSSFKNAETTDELTHPLHMIDKYSKSKNIVRYLAIQFTVEYLNTTTNAIEEVAGTFVNSDVYRIFNGYLKRTDALDRGGVFGNFTAPTKWFGYDFKKFYPETSTPGLFLTNAPTTQYANGGDYGTLAFFTIDDSTSKSVRKILIRTFDASGSSLSTDTINRTAGAGSYGYTQWDTNTEKQIGYFGCFPGNLRNWGSNFKTAYDAGNVSYYTITTQNVSSTETMEVYTIYINCPDLKGNESVRLCWLNQWGAWDYYTFTKKSIRKTSTKGTTYNQLPGTWNEATYNPYGYKGGKKSFRVNATETITINTDFLSENDNVMFEELTNSPEVYILQPYQSTATGYEALNEYVTPVRLKSTSFTKKTIANDKLIQYTFEVEKSQTLRTQAI